MPVIAADSNVASGRRRRYLSISTTSTIKSLINKSAGNE